MRDVDIMRENVAFVRRFDVRFCAMERDDGTRENDEFLDVRNVRENVARWNVDCIIFVQKNAHIVDG